MVKESFKQIDLLRKRRDFDFFLVEPNFIDKQKYIKKGNKAGFSGSHDATIALVNSGAFDAGALNKQVWENNLKNNPKRTSNLELFWITPEYVDYHWLAQGDLDNRFGEGFTKQLKSVILNLDINQKSHKQILDMFNAKRFINAEAKQYKNIEEIGRKLKKIR